MAVYAAKIGEQIPTGFNYQSFWMGIKKSPTSCPSKKCDAAVSVLDYDYLQQTNTNQFGFIIEGDYILYQMIIVLFAISMTL